MDFVTGTDTYIGTLTSAGTGTSFATGSDTYIGTATFTGTGFGTGTDTYISTLTGTGTGTGTDNGDGTSGQHAMVRHNILTGAPP